MVAVGKLAFYLLHLQNRIMYWVYSRLICPILTKSRSDVDENPIIRGRIAIIGLAKGPKPQTARILFK